MSLHTPPACPQKPMPDNFDLSRRACWAGGEPVTNLLMAQTLANPELVSLAAGFVDHDTLPVEPARAAMEQIWSDPTLARSALQYGTTIGHLPLREAILNRMLAADACTPEEVNLSPEQVVITAGSNQMLYLLCDTLLNPGDLVICAAPTYFVILGTLANLGASAVGVQSDEFGLIPEAVAEQLQSLKQSGDAGRVKAIYVTTDFDNPGGVTVPVQRREALVEIARRWSRDNHKIFIIEDTAYRELRYRGDDIPSMRSMDTEGETVIVAGSFSKSFSPGIRVGWGILPTRLVKPVLSQKGHFDFGSPNFNQMLISNVLEMGLFDPHVEKLRANYRRKIEAVLESADEFLAPLGDVHWIRPNGGLYVWIRLPENVDTGLAGTLFPKAVEEGVLYVPGEYCYPTQGMPTQKNMLRLSFGIQSCESIRIGMESLGRAIRRTID